MLKKRLPLWMLVAGSVAAPAAAQSNRDVRCLVLSNLYLAQSGDAKHKDLARAAALFYAGKVSEGWNDTRLRGELAKQGKVTNVAQAGAEMQACAKTMQSSLRHIQTLVPRK